MSLKAGTFELSKKMAISAWENRSVYDGKAELVSSALFPESLQDLAQSR